MSFCFTLHPSIFETPPGLRDFPPRHHSLSCFLPWSLPADRIQAAFQANRAAKDSRDNIRMQPCRPFYQVRSCAALRRADPWCESFFLSLSYRLPMAHNSRYQTARMVTHEAINNTTIDKACIRLVFHFLPS